jgi:hypothetical protein
MVMHIHVYVLYRLAVNKPVMPTSYTNGSVVDPDPDRIRIQEGKMTHKIGLS